MTNDSKHQTSNQPEGIERWQKAWQYVKRLMSLAIWALIVFLVILFMEWVYPFMYTWPAIDEYFKCVFSLLSKWNNKVFADIGSGFGIVSAIATSVAVFLLWRTYNLQKKELRKIIEHSRNQEIWSHVFQMCGLYRNMMDKSSYTSITPLSGSTTEATNNIKNGYESLADDDLKLLIQDLMERIDDMWGDDSTEQRVNVTKREDIFLGYAGEAFSPFDGAFRMLYRIFKYIDEIEDCDEKLKHKIARIPRSMLSNIELEAIFINSLTNRGEKMRGYVEKYKILNNYKAEVFRDNLLRQGGLQKYLREQYAPSAFDGD